MDTYNQFKCETKTNVYIILKTQFGCTYGYAYLYLDVSYPNPYLIFNV
jgi:hypothetical protein